MDNKFTKSDIKKILKMTFKYDPETVNTYLQNPQNADEEYRNTLIKLNMKKNPLEFIDKVYDTYNLHMEGGFGDSLMLRGTRARLSLGAKKAGEAIGKERAKAAEETERLKQKCNIYKDNTIEKEKCLQRISKGDVRFAGRAALAAGKTLGRGVLGAVGAVGTAGAFVADQTVGRVGRGAAAAVGMPTQATCNRCPRDWCNPEIQGNNRLFAPSSSSESRGRSSWTGFKLYPNQEDLQEHPDYQQGYYDALNEYPAGEEYEEYPAGEEQYEEYPAGQEQMQQMPMQSPYVYPINYQQQQYYE